jgi:hypothetical protein
VQVFLHITLYVGKAVTKDTAAHPSLLLAPFNAQSKKKLRSLSLELFKMPYAQRPTGIPGSAIAYTHLAIRRISFVFIRLIATNRIELNFIKVEINPMFRKKFCTKCTA